MAPKVLICGANGLVCPAHPQLIAMHSLGEISWADDDIKQMLEPIAEVVASIANSKQRRHF
jgi:hypothetical protein